MCAYGLGELIWRDMLECRPRSQRYYKRYSQHCSLSDELRHLLDRRGACKGDIPFAGPSSAWSLWSAPAPTALPPWPSPCSLSSQAPGDINAKQLS